MNCVWKQTRDRVCIKELLYGESKLLVSLCFINMYKPMSSKLVAERSASI